MEMNKFNKQLVKYNMIKVFSIDLKMFNSNEHLAQQMDLERERKEFSSYMIKKYFSILIIEKVMSDRYIYVVLFPYSIKETSYKSSYRR